MDKKFLSCLFISILGIGLRVHRLATRELWGDELFEFYQFKGPFMPFWFNDRYAMADHSAYPGEYLLNYPFVQMFGLNKWGIMIPHIIFTILGFFLLYKLCQLYFKTTWGYVVAFLLVCFHRELIFHSFEFRPYAVLPTLALGSLYFADKLMLEWGKLGAGKKLFIGLFYLFTCIYHAFGIIIFLLPVIFSLASRRDLPYVQFFLDKRFQFLGVVFLIGFPLWFWYAAFSNFGLAANIFQSVNNTFEYIPNPLVDSVGYLKAVFLNLMGSKPLYVLLLGLVIVPFLQHKEKLNQLGFLLSLIILPIGLIFLVAVLSEENFLQRHFSWVMPLFTFLVAWCWDSLVLSLGKSTKIFVAQGG